MTEEDKNFDNAGAMTRAEDWRAWKKACAADLCAPETAASLRRFGAVRFAGCVRRAGHPKASTRDPWHLLETHCQVSRTRAGKRYKDWLFARAEGTAEGTGNEWASCVEGGASLLMRAAVRDFLRGEVAPSFMTSLDKPIGNGAISLADLLPDPAIRQGGLDEAEIETLAGHMADTISLSLSKVDLVLLWARTHGISFADPKVVKMTRQGKTVLYERFQEVIEGVSRDLRKELPREDAGVVRDLLLKTVMKLGVVAHAKLFPGKPALSLL